jgi:integrase
MLPTKQSDYAITNPHTRTAYHSFYAAWFQVRKAADLDGLRIHDLRHTFASVLINKGVSIYEVQTLLGHSTIQMTQRYAHLAPDRLQNRTEIVGNIIESI